MRIGPLQPTELLRSLLKGEETSFDTVFNEFYAPLCRFASKYINDEDACKDLVQEGFVKFWEAREKLSTDHSVKTLLYTIVRNLCIDSLRREATRGKRSALYQRLNDPEPWQEEEISEVIRAETIRNLKEHIYSLPPQMQKVIWLHYMDDKPLKEISATLGISIDTVKYHKKQGLKVLRGRMG